MEKKTYRVKYEADKLAPYEISADAPWRAAQQLEDMSPAPGAFRLLPGVVGATIIVEDANGSAWTFDVDEFGRVY